MKMQLHLCRVMIVLVLVLAVSACNYHETFYSKNYEPDQPINFSHKKHAGDYKMDCLYCHFGAEKSRHAGIPPANTCLNCHWMIKTDSPEIKKLKAAVDGNTPIEWVKIHNLPDYVLFNHSRHVNKGVTCQECHGAVETMDKVRQVSELSMGWCIECHRARGVGAAMDSPHGVKMETDCMSCHY